MWELREPEPVKLIIGILAADKNCLERAVEKLQAGFGEIDIVSDVWPFELTDYYKDQTGEHILRQFVSIKELIDPSDLAGSKHKTNELEQELVDELALDLPRPINLDPGIMEPAKLILATTKNYSHRIYIGEKMYAEVTLMFDKGKWQPFEYTYPDYKQQCYVDFFEKVRKRLVEQLRLLL